MLNSSSQTRGGVGTTLLPTDLSVYINIFLVPLQCLLIWKSSMIKKTSSLKYIPSVLTPHLSRIWWVAHFSVEKCYVDQEFARITSSGPLVCDLPYWKLELYSFLWSWVHHHAFRRYEIMTLNHSDAQKGLSNIMGPFISGWSWTLFTLRLIY